MCVSDDFLVFFVAWVDVGEGAFLVYYLHGCSGHGEGEGGFAGACVADEDDSFLILRQALSQLEAVGEVLVALGNMVIDIFVRHHLFILIIRTSVRKPFLSQK